MVFESNFNVSLREVEDPKIENGSDAIVRLTSSALCGSDLHMYEGRIPPKPGLVMGHEGMGVIEAVGDAVRLRKVGERVVMPAHVYCGVCVKCAEGKTAECLTM
ncbi:MAG: alcohol dehydrogenase catalytic domain-containing protein, partial [Sulfobacillus thermotolerans]|nr:alcohol dehydrogenase catalytic domain-containing protein [Sulfobacillus thermotolerans]